MDCNDWFWWSVLFTVFSRKEEFQVRGDAGEHGVHSILEAELKVISYDRIYDSHLGIHTNR